MQETGKEFDDKAYFRGGYQPPRTDSPFLVSSSWWLSHPSVREVIAKHSLRRNHQDVPPTYEITDVSPIVTEFFIQNIAEVEALFVAERKINQALDAWFEERHISKFTLEDLKSCPHNSVGNLVYRYVVSNNYVLEFDAGRVVTPTHIDFFMKRLSQQHDFEHILGGFSFDYLGEQGVTFMRHFSYFKYLSPKLAGFMNTVYTLLLNPQQIRTMLHYPEAVNTYWDNVQQAMLVGRSSEPVFMMKYEPVLNLPVEEARKVLGYRNVVEVDYRDIANAWAEHAKLALDPRRGEDLARAAE